MRDLTGLNSYDIECIINDQDQRLSEIKDKVDEIWSASYESPEMNMNNYSSEDVEKLDHAMNEVFGIADELRLSLALSGFSDE